jgi:hypothetical protein
MKNTPKARQVVWVKFLTLEDRSTYPKPVPRASVQRKLFHHVCINYLGKAGDTRWALVSERNSKDDTFCVAYKPESVYETRAEATAALVSEVSTLILKLGEVALNPEVRL